jgi:hypothetical protein
MSTARSGNGNGLPAGVYAELVRDAITRKSPADALAAVIDMAVTSGPAEQASITMRTGRAVDSVAYSSDLILQADQLQYELNEGPCLDAVWTDELFVIPDLLADDRWPRWGPAAAGLGVGSSISVHLFTDTALGSLNLYSMHPQDYDHADLEAAKVIGAHASVVLAYTRTEQNLWQAIDTRNLIGQAQGILMQKYGLSSGKAFAVLRRYSQQHNLKLAAVAEQLTTTRTLPGLTSLDPNGNQDSR